MARMSASGSVSSLSFSAAHSASTWRANSSAPVSCTRILMRALYLLSRRP